jgi:uncharacterized lipoprotein YddW (UPF0748 family)
LHIARTRTHAALLAAATLLALSALLPSRAAAQAPDEVRALWVDAYHDGIKNQAQVDKLVADARRANVNTLIVQVRRRGDSYYLGGPEPVASDLTPGFDGLRALLDAARRSESRLEVHASIPVYPIWSSRTVPPTDPSHVLLRHGANAPGDENWLMLRDDGESWADDSYWLDPGHPAVAAYTLDLISDLVRRYDVDGLQFDRIRYYQGDSVNGTWDRRWGYNPTSVARFNQQYGRSGRPDPGDVLWMQFRRDQVTDLLRRSRESALAIRPGLKIGAAVIPWGDGPRSNADWVYKPAFASAFQDWRSWLEEGLLDQAYVMNYNREANPTQVAWFDHWLAWERANTFGRQVIPMLGVYLNTPAETIRQVQRARASNPDGSTLAGVALYSYATPDLSRADADPANDSPDGLLWDLLARPAPDNAFAPPFAEPAPVPAMAWR